MARRVATSTAAILSSSHQPTNPSHHYQSQQAPSSSRLRTYADVASSIDRPGGALTGGERETPSNDLLDGEDAVRTRTGPYDDEGSCCGDGRSQDDGEDEDDEEDRIQVVQIPYRILLLRYLLIVPPLALLCFLGLIGTVTFGWPPPLESPLAYPHHPNLALLLVGLAFFSLAHSLRLPLYTFLSLLPLPSARHQHPSSPPQSSSRPSSSLSILSAALHTLVLELLRYLSIAILVPPLHLHPHPYLDAEDEPPYPDVWLQPTSFEAAFWLGLGWAAGEVSVGVWQGYHQLSYYAPVLPHAYPSQSAYSLPLSSSAFSAFSQQHPQRPRTDPDPAHANVPVAATLPPSSSQPRSPSLTPTNASFPLLHPKSPSSQNDDEPEVGASDHDEDDLADLETQISNLLAVQQREAVESVLGVPLPNLPAIISALWRIDGILLNVGITLIMSSTHLSPSFPNASVQLYLVLSTLALVHAAVSVFWVVGMRRLGPPTTTYGSFFVALGSFIWGLGSWRALV